MNRNTSWDIALTSLGVVIGFAQNAHTVYVDIASNAPIGQWDAVATVIFVVAFALGAKSFWDWFVGKDDLRKALEELRNRPTAFEPSCLDWRTRCPITAPGMTKTASPCQYARSRRHSNDRDIRYMTEQTQKDQ